MNCGIYLPFEEGRFEKYRAGIEELKKAVESKSAKCILVTPPRTMKSGRKTRTITIKYSIAIASGSWRNERGWMVVDLHFPMVAELEAQRKVDPNFTFQPDAVHPNEQGNGLWLRCGSINLRQSRPMEITGRDAIGIEGVRSRSRIDISTNANCARCLPVSRWPPAARNSSRAKLGNSR